MAHVVEMKETEECRLLRDTASDYAAKVLAPEAEQLDRAWELPTLDSVCKAAEMGMLQALAPEEEGGGGFDAYAFCLALEEMAVGSAGAAAAVLIHNVAMIPIFQAAGDIAPLLEAKFPLSMACADKLSISGGSVSGHVPWAFNAPAASMFTLLVPDGGGVAVAEVEAGTQGLTVTPNPHQMGLRAARVASLELNGVAPKYVVRGDDSIRKECERYLHLGFAAISVGISRNGFSAAHAYAQERYQGGDMIIHHQALRIMMADMVSGIEMSRAMIASACEQGDLASAISCRIEATDRALRSATDAVQVHGGIGYMEDYGMERLMRDAAYCQIYPHSNEESRLELLDLVEQQ
jgi:alkylation response protein AidB-like acyl-CoA dehydrogenase